MEGHKGVSSLTSGEILAMSWGNEAAWESFQKQAQVRKAMDTSQESCRVLLFQASMGDLS